MNSRAAAPGRLPSSHNGSMSSSRGGPRGGTRRQESTEAEPDVDRRTSTSSVISVSSRVAAISNRRAGGLVLGPPGPRDAAPPRVRLVRSGAGRGNIASAGANVRSTSERPVAIMRRRVANRLPPAPAFAPPQPPAEEGPREQAMNLLKRMRPDELMAIGEAATALAKRKLEDRKKIAAFAAKQDNFVELVEDCYICLEPLLNNIGTTKFGVVSWKCRCTVPQKAHSRCVFSKICHATNGQGKCDMCKSPMEFEKTTRKGTHAMIRFHRDETHKEAADASRAYSYDEEEEVDGEGEGDQEEEEDGEGEGNQEEEEDGEEEHGQEEEEEEEEEEGREEAGRFLSIGQLVHQEPAGANEGQPSARDPDEFDETEWWDS